MSKTTKKRKDDARALAEARQLTPGKVFRLVLKSLGFAILVSLLVFLLGLVVPSARDNFWIQLPLMLVVYIAAYPFLMREFRPKRSGN